MTSYIALGCSLTAQDGFIDHLCKSYNFNITNLAVSGGSNILQDLFLKNKLINGEVSNDTVLLWQITYPGRYHAMLNKNNAIDFCHGTPGVDIFDWFPFTNDLFDSSSIALLTNNAYFRELGIPSPLAAMQETIATIYQWSCIVKKIIVYFGWSNMLPRNYLDLSVNFLTKKNNIQVLPIEDSILDWCARHHLPMADSGHPSKESYICWGEQVLLPYLIE